MKKIKTILLIIATITFTVSCEDDGGTSVIPLEEGAAPNLVKATSAPAFIDQVKAQNGEPITLEFNVSIAQGNPASTDIIGVYTTFAGPVYNAVLFSNVTLPQDFSLTTADVVAAFSEIDSGADLQVGDMLTITTRFTMPDGTILDIVSPDGVKGGTGTNIQTTVLFTTVLNYPVSCTSNLGGTHSFVSSNLQAITGTCPSGDVSGTVTWTDQGGGIYLTSDLGFGQYGTTCWSDSPATSGGATFSDACNLIISGGQDQYGLTYTWVITDVNGPEMSLSWSNDYGDSGDVVLTREGGVDWPDLFTQ
ncbi:hypothetical protein HZY62_01510 [Maribacter polysiphoniae]|uniref:Uncharacterized protein n=1 Tax=Maribacter polysiphoniae TaxID=429344 RepID=A0A316EP84_9FLAO|nr:hypothetical protein [Maribacter polysiphoniae]MBD1259250.1 hypothetical protein [Maribacter polysiphoniae]PWK24810.1 hypothetical protein LX92_01175 [Maribacter polysiphoniae]